MSEDTCYTRVIIEGELTALSDLHVGAATQALPEGEEPVGNDIMLDCMEQPYIPGSSLRGLLRALIGAGSPAGISLFGQARLTEEEKAGKLRVYDARVIQRVALVTRSRIKKNPVTATAEDKHLIHDQVVPRDSRFLVRLQADGIRKSEVKILLQALQCLGSGSPDARLGAGKSIGRGHIRWRALDMLGLDSEAFEKWLDSDDALEEAGWVSIELPEDEMVSEYEQWCLRFVFDEPVLINDPGNKGEPDLRYLREDNRLLITGASLKGLFRARARRILMTIASGSVRVDSLVDEMFGSADGISRWFFDDILAQITEVHQQTIIAVDRFTGGVKAGAMLNLEAAVAAPAEAVVSAHIEIPGWQKLIWLYCLRDAMEGDLNIGWGAARGFGAFQVEFMNEDGKPVEWAVLLAQYEPQITEWDRKLQEKLTETDKEETGEEAAA